jgi:hypothetical protein
MARSVEDAAYTMVIAVEGAVLRVPARTTLAGERAVDVDRGGALGVVV